MKILEYENKSIGGNKVKTSLAQHKNPLILYISIRKLKLSYTAILIAIKEFIYTYVQFYSF